MSDALREILGMLEVKVTGTEAVTKAQAQIDHLRDTMNRPLPGMSAAASSFNRAAAPILPTASVAPLATTTSGATSGTSGTAGADQASSFSAKLATLSHGFRVLHGSVQMIRGILDTSLFQFVRLGDELDALSQRTGLSTTELQRWRFIAAKGNLDADSLTTAIGRMQKAAVLAPAGFRALGVQTRDASGHVKSTSQLFRETGLAIASIANPAERAARAQVIFGRAGAALIPVFADGGASIDEMSKRFDELGGGMEKEFSERAHKASDAMEDLKVAATSVTTSLELSMLPAFTDLITSTATIGGHFADMVRHSSAADVALYDLAIAAGVLGIATWEVTLPVLGATAALAALFLVTDDVLTAFRGGHSVFGEWEESMARSIGITETFQGQIETTKIGFYALKAAWLDAAASILAGVIDVQSALHLSVDPRVVLAARGYANMARTANAEAARETTELRKNEADRIAARTMEAKQAQVDAMSPAVRAKADDTHTRPRDQWSARDQRGKTATKIQAPVTIHVHGISDPSAVAQHIESRILGHFRAAADEFPVLPSPDGESDDS